MIRVKAPKAWRPEPRDELIGTYLGFKKKEGKYGLYKAHYIKSRGNIFFVSGISVNGLFAMVKENMKVKLVFNGEVALSGDRTCKSFELFTQEELTCEEF